MIGLFAGPDRHSDTPPENPLPYEPSPAESNPDRSSGGHGVASFFPGDRGTHGLTL